MDGLIIINKEKGYTSNDVVQIVKKIFNEKVGHTGTLDPMATGVLPLLIGKGTLISKYLINHDKIYHAILKLGIKTDTGDSEGKTIEQKEILPEQIEKSNIKNVLESFMGEQIQVPPIYSAIKVKGKKLYEYARNGQEVEIPSRKIRIYNMKLIDIDKDESKIEFEVSCSKGTYIRTLCEDIAKRLGTVGYMSDLKRIKVGDFDIKDSITIDELKENPNIQIIKMETFFYNYDKIILENKDLVRFYNGVKLNVNKENGIFRVYDIQNNFIGTGIVKDGFLKRDIVI